MKQFYTYLHCKPDGMPFYVGKGNYGRAYEFMSGRNRHHKNIVAKYGKENIGVFVFPCDSEEQAFSDEKQQIAQLRRDGYVLANQTDGGEGKSGCIASKEAREKISASLIGNKHTLGHKHTKESKKKMSDSTKIALSNPDVRAKMAISAKNKMSLPGARENLSLHSKKKWQSEEHRNYISNKTTEQWRNPEIREKMLSKRTGRKHSPESREKMSISAKLREKNRKDARISALKDAAMGVI